MRPEGRPAGPDQRSRGGEAPAARLLVLVPFAVITISVVLAIALAFHLHASLLAFGLGGAGLGSLALLPFKSYRRGSLDSELASHLDVRSLVRTKRISIPGFKRAYNPSMIEFGAGYCLCFRVRYYSLVTFLKRVVNVRTSYLGIVQLDSDFRISGIPRILEIRSWSNQATETAQDGRLIWFGGRALLFFNDYGASRDRRTCAIYVVALVESEGALAPEGPAVSLVYDRMGPIEKNWIPFVAGDRLLLVYSGQPHCVLEPDLATGRCREVSVCATDAHWKWGEIRGGTPAFPVEEGFMTFFHSSRELPAQTIFGSKIARSYAMGAYIFDNASPFRITRISAPLGSKDFYADNRRMVVFPSGVVREGPRIHVSWGKNDEQVWVSTFDAGLLVPSLLSLS